MKITDSSILMGPQRAGYMFIFLGMAQKAGVTIPRR